MILINIAKVINFLQHQSQLKKFYNLDLYFIQFYLTSQYYFYLVKYILYLQTL